MYKVLDHGYVRLIDHMGDDLRVVNAARASYAKEKVTLEAADEKLIDFLARLGHESPFRLPTVVFEVKAPLFVARQWWKHHVASSHVEDCKAWNEQSRRYVTAEPELYVPDEFRGKPANSKQGSSGPVDNSVNFHYRALLMSRIRQGKQDYEQAIESGIAPEDARLFLPAYGMYVTWYWQASLAAIFHFYSQRIAHDAQWAIQQYAQVVGGVVEELYPLSWSALSYYTSAARRDRLAHELQNLREELTPDGRKRLELILKKL